MYPRRFFKILFNHGMIEIYNTFDNLDNVTRLRFSDVASVEIPDERKHAELV